MATATATRKPTSQTEAPVRVVRPDKLISRGTKRGGTVLTAQVTYSGRTHHCVRLEGTRYQPWGLKLIFDIGDMQVWKPNK